EGVGCAVLPKQGLGIALKIDDGTPRAREVALAALIRATKVLSDEQWRRAGQLINQPVTNRNGLEVGVVRPAEG
ncbi:asparaginase, partial [Azospirillum formosense]